MSKIKQQLKKIHKIIIDSIRIIFKDPFNPFPEENKGSGTDNHEKRKEN